MSLDPCLASAVDEYAASHQMHASKFGAAPLAVQATEVKSKLSDLLAKLKALNIPWMSILPYVMQIISALFSGTKVADLLAQVLTWLSIHPVPGPFVP